MRLFLELLLLCLFAFGGPALFIWLPDPFGIICLIILGIILACVAFG